ncbi:glycosyl hydrolase family 18 protein [Blautia sp.]|uniref:glycosyl hydrolase family 18 protein n=1 Tax=Blautia sp. TaxID=1955243 RepID=UPI002586B203|nr:glycosyl hydrolase family 18 protein [Blautia sp.]
MAKRRKRRRRRRSFPPALIALFLIVIVGAAGLITTYVKKYTPSDIRMDLADYYKLESPEEVALIFQDTLSEYRGRFIEDMIYLPYQAVTGVLGGRFYWDQETQSMLYTTPDSVIEIQPDMEFQAQGQEQSFVPVRKLDESLYIALDFLENYMQIESRVYEKPARVVITYEWQKIQTVEADRDTVVRYQGGIKSPILSDVKAGDSMELLEELENWSRVLTKDGIDGYVKKEDLKASKTAEPKYQGAYEENFTSLTRDYKINLAWHQVTSEAANGAFEQTVKDLQGVNVISPTWFSVTGTEGTISSLASAEYVEKAHKKGMEVWGLIDNFDKNVSTLETLSKRSARTHIIEMLLSEAKRVGMDGINLDFEALTEEEAPHFIQFVRELSVMCRANNLVLSVDNPVPQYTSFYNRKEQGIVADYVIIMGYDEHTVGAETAGSVASLPFVEAGIVQTLKEVPKEKVINGVPFYTRLWTENNNGAVTSEVFGMDQAEKYVQEKGMEVYWNKDVSQNYGELATSEGTQKIWLEDEKSLEAKMKLIQQYELAGVAEWKLGFERADVWPVISKYLQ